MPFQNGHKLSNGRPKGSKNKKTIKRLEMIEKIIDLIEKGLEKDIKSIKDKDRVELWKDLQEYILPKQQRANQEGDQSVNINITIDSDDNKV